MWNVISLSVDEFQQRVMSNCQELNDEFIVLPGTNPSSNTLIDITRMGSHDPVSVDACGRQHRPTGPCETLRSVELIEGSLEPGPGR